MLRGTLKTAWVLWVFLLCFSRVAPLLLLGLQKQSVLRRERASCRSRAAVAWLKAAAGAGSPCRDGFSLALYPSEGLIGVKG